MRARRLALAVLAGLGCAAGCTFHVPREGLGVILADPPAPSERERVEGAPPAPARFVPIPGLARNENTGFTFGLMPAIAVGEPGRTQSLISPSLTWNEVNGLRPTLRFYRYLGGGAAQLEGIASHSTAGATNYRGLFRETRLLPGLVLTTQARSHRDLGGRFFGFGERTHERAESAYRHYETSGFVELRQAVPGAPWASLVAFPTLRVIEVRGSALDDFPSTRVAFAGDPGVGRYSTAIHWRAGVAVDTLDRLDAPTSGVSAMLWGDRVSEGSGADFSAWAYGLDCRAYWPVTSWFGIAARGVADYVVGGSEVPFTERAALGGQDLLRGFPEQRFVDDGRTILQVEARLGAVELRLLGGQAGINLVPFLDVGRVFSRWSDLDRTGWQPVGGLGIRLEMPPSTRGRLDIGFGREGVAVYLTLGYPF